jgi:hypothetical protein
MGSGIIQSEGRPTSIVSPAQSKRAVMVNDLRRLEVPLVVGYPRNKIQNKIGTGLPPHLESDQSVSPYF